MKETKDDFLFFGFVLEILLGLIWGIYLKLYFLSNDNKLSRCDLSISLFRSAISNYLNKGIENYLPHIILFVFQLIGLMEERKIIKEIVPKFFVVGKKV